MITCPACGTVNREWASHCGECGKPLPDDARRRPRATDAGALAPQTERLPGWLRRDVEARAHSAKVQPSELGRRESDLPPIPDGGLADSMPSWLAGSHHEALSAPASPPPTGQRLDATDEAPDVTTFLSPEDLPVWLRRLAEMEAKPAAAPGDLHPAPAVLPTGLSIGDETDEIPSSDDHHAPTTAIRAAPVAPPAVQPSVRRPALPRDDALPAPAADRRLTAFILAGLALAAVMIAYALYLGIAG
ncbi:MAG: hypothetical protein ACRDJH_01065 [Thermomicrobiales bacterium]